MPKEFKVGLSFSSGDIIEVTKDDHILIRDKDCIRTIKKTFWILSGFSTLKAGKYKVTEKGTLVPYKPLPELKSGEICEVILFDGDRFVSFYEGSRKDNIGIFYTFNHEPTNASVAQHILIDSIQSITILKPVSE